jgi:hypothetical protein
MSEGTNKLNREHKHSYDNVSSFKYLKYGQVVTNNDTQNLGRIKVRIKGSPTAGGDDGILDIDLPYAFPMIPKHFASVPKIGEAVWIFVFDKNSQHADRIYIGPIISQPDKLSFDDAKFTALRGFSFGATTPNVNVNTIPQLRGIFPDLEDISVQGRYNTDITQKNNEIVLRAGKFEVIPITSQSTYGFQFNTKTQAFIQMKNDVVVERPSKNNSETKKGTITTIVANKINLITHDNGSPRFNITGQDTLISDEEMDKILTEAHQMVFGDVLLEYLILLKEALFSHVHNGNGKSPTDLTTSGNKQALALFKSKANDLEKAMLSLNVRIN